MGKGNDGQRAGGDTTDLIIKSVAAVGGAMVGGPAGAKMGWDMGGMASDMITGKGDGTSDSWSAKLNKVGDTVSGIGGMASGMGGGGGSDGMGSALTKVLGQGGSGGKGGPSLEMPSTAPGLRTDFLSPEELARQNKLNGIGSEGGSGAVSSDVSGMAKRLLGFFNSMQGGQSAQQPPAQTINFPQANRPAYVPQMGMYNVSAPQLMPVGKPVYNMMTR